MILVFASLLVIIHHVIINLPKPLDCGLLVAGILSTGDFGIELVHHLETITKIVLNSRRSGLIIEHIKHLAKVHGSPVWSSVSHQPEHDYVRVVLQLNTVIHPNLP
nr:AC5 protein [Cnidoscolus mosaic leaf deformation virus]UBR90602.1 AC5 protein [Cnidoscolus mosaic leaf deformation virus]